MGIDRREYLYELTFWELLLISRGYERRHYSLWSAVRWMTYYVVSAIPYTDLPKAGIHKATDLLPLPWEKKESAILNDDERDELQNEMDMLSEAWANQ